jgi:uncharacterized RDD family membrane protein YckC
MESGQTQPSDSPHRGYFRWRALACAIDYGIFFAVCFAYIRIFGFETESGYQVQGCAHTLPLAVLWFALFPLPEAVFGRTLGKWGTDFRVVTLTNGPINIGQAIVRRLFDSIDLSFFGLVGYLVAKSNPLNQRVGDLVAKTRVVPDE